MKEAVIGSIRLASMLAVLGALASACGGAAPAPEVAPPAVGAPVARSSDGESCGCRWVHLPADIRFAPRSSAVHPDDEPMLAELAQSLDAHPSIVAIRVEGHSGTCSEEMNDQALSEARADAVRDRLVAHGVAREMLLTIGYATSQPRKGRSRRKERAERCDAEAPTSREATFERRVEFSVRICERETPRGPEACPAPPD